MNVREIAARLVPGSDADRLGLAPNSESDNATAGEPRASWKIRAAVCLCVFAVALAVRLLYLGPASAELYGVEQERYRVAHFYHEAAAALAEGNDRVVFPTPLGPDDTLAAGYPPGYFVLMAAVYRVADADMRNVLFAQCVLDALAAALLVLLGERLFSLSVGAVAGTLMAVAPQFAYLSLVIKPDTLTVLPVLIALIFFVDGTRRRALAPFVWCGLALGVACWLRQNALLLAPLLAVAALLLSTGRGRDAGAAPRGATWRFALAIVVACGALVAPITIRNLVLYGEPIPVTFGSGFALLSGLARDDYANKYGLARFAYNVTVEEAEARGLEPHAFVDRYDEMQANEARKFEVKHTVLSVFAVDAIGRDRERTRRALALVRRDPAYYLSICARRAWRLVDYTAQRRVVPLDVDDAAGGAGAPEHAYESHAFFQALGESSAYYASRGERTGRLRAPLARVQQFFATGPLLLLAAIGLALLLAAGAWRRALLLALLIVYYVGLQSLMWAEFRHTLPIHLALFLFAGVASIGAVRLVRLTRESLPRRR